MLRADLIRPLPETLRSHADRIGARTAFHDGRRSVDYVELEAGTRRLAGHLAGSLGLARGARVALLLDNAVEVVESYLAVHRAAGVGVPVNPRSADEELAHILGDSGAAALITDARHAEQVRRVLAGRGGPAVILVGDAPDGPGGSAAVLEGAWSFDTLRTTEPPAPARDDLGLDEPAWILYTSGTTGLPKGVVSTERSCLWSVAAAYVPILGLSEDDHVLWPLPLFHSLAHVLCVMGVTSVGASARIVADFSPEGILELLREDAYTYLVGVPTMYQYLLRAGETTQFSAPALRTCLVTGAVATPDLGKRFEAAFGLPLLDTYGSTETSGAITASGADGARVEGSCGAPVPGLGLRIVDPETLREVRRGEEGEIWVSGPNVMLGYHNAPEATAAALVDGAWYRTGDLARQDRHGYVSITGRIKELIIRGGENIHPGEIERVLLTVEGVADAAVAARPDALFGEVPAAYLVPTGEGAIDPARVFAVCRENLAHYKVPTELHTLAAIPRTASGKVRRHLLAGTPSRLLGLRENILHTVEWAPAPPAARPVSPVVVGEDPFGLGSAVGSLRDLPAGAEPVVCAWGDVEENGLGEVNTAVWRVLKLIRGWLGRGADAGRLVVLTRGAVAASGGEQPVDLAGAAVWGLIGSVQAEHPGRVAVLDLEAADPAGDEAGELRTDGLAALLGALGEEPQAAVRGGRVRVPRLVRAAASGPAAAGAVWDPAGTVLVAGALDGSGRAAVLHLARVHGVRSFLAATPSEVSTPRVQAWLGELAALGARVRVLETPAGDRGRELLVRALAEVPAHRPVRGVLQLPGTVGADGLTDSFDALALTRPQLDRALRESAGVAWTLHELTAGLPLTAFVTCANAAGVLGAAGWAHAAAGDAFLGALAGWRASVRGLPGVALAWGPREGAEHGPGALNRLATAPLTGVEELAVLDAATARREAAGPLVAFRFDVPRIRGLERAAVPPLLRGLIPAEAAAPPADGGAAVDEAAEQERFLRLVLAEVALQLGGIDPRDVDPDKAFRELQFGSVAAVELRNGLAAATGLRLPTTLAFDYPTARRIAGYLRLRASGGTRGAAELAQYAQDANRRRSAQDLEDPIVIVGMACRYPGGVGSPEEFWALIADRRDGIGPFPTDRGWNTAEIFDPEDAVAYTPEGGFVADATGFDAGFFGISPREALTMDPQQRLLLESSWQALEHAGIDPVSLHGSRTGVFAGLMYHDYALRLAGTPDYVAGFVDPGIAGSVASGRVAYLLGLTGPAITVDTACSSSLVALHWAVQALRNGECSTALAGGVTVMSTPGAFAGFARQGGLAVDGRCKSYSGAADGTGWAEGVGMLVLERLSDARRLGHRVWGLVKGSAINQDGASNGLTAPNGPSQERVILQALANAGLDVADVDLVEGHGTGTTLGDPIEAQALLATYGQGREADRPLWLGSVKSNIGHTQAAAGVAGVIKAVLAMQNAVMPATLHVDEPSPKVDWTTGAVALLTQAREWPRTADGRARRAGVSSFGISGTNAHVIIEEGDPEPEATEPLPVPAGGLVAWPLSAKTETALHAQALRLAQWAHGDAGGSTTTQAGLVLAGRTRFERRAVVLGADRAALVEGLRALAAGQPNPDVFTGTAATPVSSSAGVLVFPGQGWQRVGLGRGLLASGGVFADVIGECGAALRQWTDFDLVDVLAGEDEAWLERVDVVQPVLWAVMVGLAREWESLGVVPSVVVGHSQGEIAAAVIGGALSLEDGARVVAVRSRVIREHLAGSGAMASVSAAADVVQGWIAKAGLGDDGAVSVAAVNGPGAVTVSGVREPLREFVAGLEERGVRVRVLGVDYASHSAMVERIEGVLGRELAGLRPRALAPGRRWLSTVTKEWMRGDEADAGYWYRNLRAQVAFAPVIEDLVGQGHGLFVEASGHPVLTSGIEQVLAENGAAGLVSGSLRRDTADAAALLGSAARLFTAGAPIDWPQLLLGAQAEESATPPIVVPGYAFDRTRYWPEPSADTTVGDVSAAGLVAAGHPLLGAAVGLVGGGCVLSGRLSVGVQSWLADHAVSGTVLLAGAAVVELVLRAGQEAGCGFVRELTLQAPVVMPEDGALQLQVTVSAPDVDGCCEVAVHTRLEFEGGGEWTLHASGFVSVEPPVADGIASAEYFVTWPPRGAVALPVEGMYERLAEIGVEYGPSFRALRGGWCRGGEVFAEVEVPEAGLVEGGFGVHPVLLDAALQAWVLAQGGGGVRMPFVFSGVRLSLVGASRLRVRVVADADGGVGVVGVDDAGAEVVSVGSMVTRPVDLETVRTWRRGAGEGLLGLEWIPAPSVSGAGAGAVGDVLVVDRGRGPGEVAVLVWEVLERVRAWLSDVEAAGRLVVVTQGAVAASADESVTDLAAAAVWGLIRTTQVEHPDRVVLLDTNREISTSDLSGIVGGLGDEDQAAVRDGRVFVPRLARVTAGRSAEGGEVWDRAGTVLVTGGTGGLGRHVVRHLVKTHGIRSLLILSRSGPSGAGAQALVGELAALGARVRLVAADVGDRGELERAIAGVPERWPLRGVVHVAGVVDDGVALSLTRPQIERVLRVKADATWALHELTADLPLTAFVTFSSAAAILGAGGQANYAAGNAFLDGLASWRHAQGLPATSLAWGLWDEQDGMGGRLTTGELKRLQRLAVGLSVEQGLDLLDAALADGSPTLVPLRFNAAVARSLDPVPPLFRSLVRNAPRRAVVGGAVAASGDASLATRLAGLDPATQLEELLTLVRTHAAAILRHASAQSVEVERTFKYLGFDSLTAVELRNSLQAALGRPLPATVVFDHPSPRELGEHLRELLPGGTRRAVLVHAAASATDEPIAIVGMACRFPGGASTAEEFWSLLADGRDAVTGFPTDRGWDETRAALYDPDPQARGRSYTRHGAFLHDAADFDAGFFGISPREALAMDPQQRLLLETSWEALEQAGVDPDTLRGSSAGVFVGTNGQDYGRDAAGLPDEVEGYLGIGSSASVMSGRVAYVLGLTGPAMTVDTACSSSLVALHLAAQSLRNGECTLALTGGVTVMADPGPFVEFSRQQGLSVDGRCKAFAAAADGFGMAEGIGVLVVERLSDARRNGHRVLGLLRGSAVNQDGASNGLTAPNGPSQERVILQALANAGLDVADVDLVEGHGTGTTLGDPIEAQALLATYGQGREDGRPLWLGSVKSNIGHTQAAAGVAGVIKALLAMRHEQMPRTLHVDEPSPHVDWSVGEVRLLTREQEWRREGGRPRRAGVSSFGISGTNAHVIIEEGDPEPEAFEPLPVPEGGVAWPISAKSAGALRAQASRLAQWTADAQDGLVETAAALAVRTSYAHRAVVLGADRGALVRGLRAVATGEPGAAGIVTGTASLPGGGGPSALVFPGQGWQRVGVGRGLLASGGVFADVIGECGEALRQWTDFDLVDVIESEDDLWLDRVDVVQPVLWAVMVGLARMWQDAGGYRASAVLGHSQGEIAAAVLAGALSVPEAARVVAVRSRVIRDVLAGSGAMASVAAPPAEVEAWIAQAGLTGRVSVAALNGPTAVTISGERDALLGFTSALEERAVRVRVVGVDYASHSPMVEQVESVLRRELAGLAPVPASGCGWLSTVTGEWMRGDEADAEYWYRNLREPVRFAPMVEQLVRTGYTTFVEASAHPVLTTGIEQVFESADATGVVTGTLRRDTADRAALLISAARLFTAGVPIEWAPLLGDDTAPTAVAVPGYAFDHARYWLESRKPSTVGDVSAAGLVAAGHPLLGAAVGLVGGGCVLSGRLSVGVQSWLADHAVSGTVLLAGAAVVELVLRAGQEAGCGFVRELTLQAPVVMPEDGALQLQVTVSAPDVDGCCEVAVHTRLEFEGGGEWTLHASGFVSVEPPVADGIASAEYFVTWPPRGAVALPVEGMYERLAEIGVEYGPSFRALRGGWCRGGEVFAEVEVPEAGLVEGGFGVHPVLLDAALQAWVLAQGGGGVRMPFVFSGVRLSLVGASRLRVRVVADADGGVGVVGVDDAGAEVVSVGSMVTRPVDLETVRTWRRGAGEGLLGLEWIPAPSVSGAGAGAVGDVLVVDRGRGPGEVAVLVWEVLERVRAWLSDVEAAGRLVVVTQGAVAASADESVTDLAAAAVWGLIRTTQVEHPDRVVLLDTNREISTSDLSGIVGGLGDEDQAAVRDGRVFVPRLARVTAGRSAEGGEVWDRAGTVLVTGGTGGLGRHVVRHLVKTHGIRSLLILSRSGPSGAGAQALVGELAALGARVRLVAADVGDRGELERAIAGVPERWPLRGVVHVAGVVDDGVALSLTRPQIERVLRVKADATWALHELTADLPLTVFALYSGAAGILGGGGQANYAAGNAFLDGLASWRHAQGLPATSLAWGLWDEQGGMGGRLTTGELKRLQRSAVPLSVEQGLELLDAAVLAGDLPVVVPLRLNMAVVRALDPIPALLRGLVRHGGTPRRAATGTDGSAAGTNAGPGDGFAARLAALDEDAQLREVLALIRATSAAVLGHSGPETIEPDESFKLLGVDSLTAVEVRNSLAVVTGLTLPPTLVFDHPSPRALAGHLHLRLTAALTGGVPAAAAASRAVVVHAAAAAEEPIAIVGMACRFPGGADTPEQFWQLLAQGRDTMTGFPVDRGWAEAQEAGTAERHDADADADAGSGYARQGAFLHDAGRFDAGFFGISPHEALAMDPQQRLLLETSWEALERAGIDPEALRGGNAGVFVGTNGQDYGRAAAAGPALTAEVAGYLGIGSSASVMSGRVSYALGLTGPAVTVDTACSSSLVALHWAAQALRSGECTLALAGGVTVMATPLLFPEFARQGGLAADGRCKSYSGAADGTGWGEGVGMLVVERLSDARRLGHRVLGLLRGSAVNQDGASNGLTAPNGPSQERVVLQALANAGLETTDVDLVEGHGTGTRLGDPIEAQALLATYGQGREEDRPLWLGSVKSNIGHTQAAAGVAGVMKALLAMQYEQMPRTLHVDEPSPHVDWTAGRIALLAESRAWPREAGRPRLAGVSSFGISGTNAHVVIEEGDPKPAPRAALPVPAGGVAWVLSSKSARGVRAQAARLAQWAEQDAPDEESGASAPLVESALALAGRRARLTHRAAVVGADRAELAERLRMLAEGVPAPGVFTGSGARPEDGGGVAVLFSGQGSQYAGMGLGLYGVLPEFTREFTAVCAGLGLDPEFLADADADRLGRTEVTQPALFAVQVAVFRQLEAWGLEPDWLGGHSIGELTAAYLAGLWDLEGACAIVAARGRLMGRARSGGAMAALEATEAQVLEALSGMADRVGIAAVNGPTSLVVSGDADAVDSLVAAHRESGRRARRLSVSHAFHSRHMDEVLAEYEQAVAAVPASAPRIRLVSTLTGVEVGAEVCDPSYWVRQLRGTVRFGDAVAHLAGAGVEAFVDISPDGVLTSMIAEALPKEAADIPVISTLAGPATAEPVALLRAAAALHASGAARVDWPAVLADGVDEVGCETASARVDLPTHAFDRTSYWLEISGGSARHPAAGAPSAAVTAESDADEPAAGAWQQRLRAASPAERGGLLLDLVREQVRLILGYSGPEDVDVQRGLLDLGFSSVSGVELSKRLSEATGLRLPATLIFDYGTAAAVVQHLVVRTDEGDGSGGAATAADFDRLERALSVPSAERGERERVAAGLERLLRLWRSSAPDAAGLAGDATGGVHDLESADADELLSFIREDLGLDEAVEGL